MKKFVILLLISFSTSLSFAQQNLTVAPPASVGFSATRLDRVDKLLQDYVDKKWISGGTAIIARNGKIIYHKAIGYDNPDTKTPMKKDGIFRIASQTKAITSVAVMMLYEEGKFMLDDPISKYIPEFANQKVLDKFNEADTTFTTVPAKRPVSIRDLLTHSSGLDYAQIGSKEAVAIYAKYQIVGGIGVDKIVLADKMKILGGLPLFHQPGEKWTYGLNTDVLGYLVEVISGISLDEFFRKRIFEPLGMKDSYFYLPPAKYSRLVTLVTEDSTKHVMATKKNMNINGEFRFNYPAEPGTYFSGGGGLSCTALDYAIFMQMLVNGGEYNGKRILSPATIRMMTSEQYKFAWGDSVMGLGFSIATEKSSARAPLSAGSYEWGGMFSSSYWVDPKQKIVAQLFLNQYPNSHGEIHDKFKVMVYQAMQTLN